MEEVATWLAANMAPDAGAALIHNDYKYDNVVLSPENPTKIIGVLDWEMATLGDPLMDLGTSLGYWIQSDDPETLRLLPVGPTHLPGNMTRREVVAHYEDASGRTVAHPVFYYAYALFKIAVIVQQIYARFVNGLTKDPRFAAMGHAVKTLSDQAARAIEADRIDSF
jgi:aminoglycoside phosphotransferase (APT) family kinase protein